MLRVKRGIADAEPEDREIIALWAHLSKIDCQTLTPQAFWQVGQKKVERCAWTIRWIGPRPQVLQG